MSKGWHGDSIRHSLASKGIRTTEYHESMGIIESNYGAINHFEINDFESLCARGILSNLKEKAKAGVSKVKAGFESAKTKFKSLKKDVGEDIKTVSKKYDETKTRTKKVLSSIGGFASSLTKEAIKMGKEMVGSASMFMDIQEEEDTGKLSEATKTRMTLESKRIDNDIKTLENKIRDIKKEIRESERNDEKDFREWYKNEKDVYEEMKNSIKSSGLPDREIHYQLRSLELEFKSNIQFNKNVLNETKDINDADVLYLRKFIEDLKRLQREINGRVKSGY